MKYFYIVSSFVGFIPFIIGSLNFNKLDKNLKIIFYLVLIDCVFNLLMIYYGLMFNKNVWLGHFYTILEFFFIAFFFYACFEREVFKRVVISLKIIFIIVVTFNKIFLETFDKIDNYTLTIGSILLLIMSSMFLVEYLTKNLIINLKDYKFILTVGFMIYFGGDLFIFALSNDIIGIWIIHNIFNILLMIIYALVFLWQN